MSTQLSQLPLFGRKYKVDVLVPQANGSTTTITVSSDTFEPEALRVTFDVYQRAFQTYWYADVVIYNLDQATSLQLLGANAQNLEVVVAAGYQNGAYATIWSGPVFQALFDRENVTDYKITLVCVTGLLEETRNLINKTFAAGILQSDLVQQIARQAFNPIQVNGISSNLSKKQLPRGKTAFGKPGTFFTNVAVDNNMQWWLDSSGMVLKGLSDDDVPTSPSLTFAPPPMPGVNTAGNTNTFTPDGVIVGTPQQTQYGVSFRVLLDPRLQIKPNWTCIKIDNSLIRFAKKSLGDNALTVLDQDGVYIVGGVRFLGDTRGNDWYADVEGYTTYQGKAQLLQQIAQGY